MSRFGAVTLYANSERPGNVALFVSGDGGWNLGVVNMARELAKLDTLVVGIDIRTYLRNLQQTTEACAYPAEDFEALSQFVQKRLKYPAYVAPVLIGYSSGATLVYAVLAQAPPTTFRGAISLGFCPDLQVRKPFCRGSGLELKSSSRGIEVQPATHLEPPWVALQGTVDQVCDSAATRTFVEQVGNGELVMLPQVGHGYAVERRWMPQFKQAYQRLLARKPADMVGSRVEDLADLPLIDLPAASAGDTMAVWITGDGGWGVTDKGVAAGLAQHGVPVVAINSLHYFWKERTPEQAAADLTRVLRRYQSIWRKDRIVLIGYSFGADVLPFLVSRLPADLSRNIAQVSLLGLGREADFEVHLSDWFGPHKRANSLPTIPEMQKLRGKKTLCFYGDEDEESACRDLPAGSAKLFSRKGGHRFGRDYDWIVEAILKEL